MASASKKAAAAAPAAATGDQPAEAGTNGAPGPMVGATVHFYDQAMVSAGHPQGAGPYPAIVLSSSAAGVGLDVRALGLHRPLYAVDVAEYQAAKAACPEGAEPPRYWTALPEA